MKKRTTCILILSLLILGALQCNHRRPCVHPGKLPIWEPFGPTDVNAASGNGRLSVLFNAGGTVTVFKWPNPSYYDHVKYFTSSRDKTRMGALPNEGVFSGIYYEMENGSGYAWLRDWPHEQVYPDPGYAVIVTTFKNNELGLTVRQTDWVDPDLDALFRHYRISRSDDSTVKSARLTVYSNFNPVVTKFERLPIADWCLECIYDSRIEYDPGAQALVQFKEDTDRSTGERASVAIAVGLSQPVAYYQAGNDSRARILPVRKKDAFDLISSGRLENSGSAGGQVTAGLMTDIDFDDENDWQGTAYFAVGGSRENALAALGAARELDHEEALLRVRSFWSDIIRGAAMPDTEDERIVEVARVTVMSLVLGFCRDSGAVVAGTSTQPPYGPDWPSNGSYINQAFLRARLPELALAHNRFYARTQSRPENPIRRVPFGNWPANIYPDGVPGMPLIPWEIDETGFMVWNLWSYYEATGDTDYLEEIYPVIGLTADFLVEWRDPKTGLQKPSHEVDNPFKTQTVFGAATACLGLKYAILAAEALGRTSDASRWTKRYEELRKVILGEIYNREKGCFVRPPFDSPKSACDFNGLYVIWPGELLPSEDPRIQNHADALWEMMQPALNGEAGRGSYESMAWLALAKAWKNDPEKLKLVRRAIAWNARGPTTTTGHLGEIWIKNDSSVIAGESQPQLWNHALFYLAALEAFGETTE